MYLQNADKSLNVEEALGTLTSWTTKDEKRLKINDVDKMLKILLKLKFGENVSNGKEVDDFLNRLMSV